MALNSSGPISLGGAITGQSINLELGQAATATTSLNATNVRTLAGVTTPGSAIIMPTNFYGKANEFPFNLSGTDVDLRTAALAAGWNGTTKVAATVQSGATVISSTTGGYALTINGSFPNGVTLTNLGTIQGKGGQGGLGGAASINCDCFFFSRGGQTAGSGAGPGLLVQVPVTITNGSGVIGGGGGGGGGGRAGSSFVSSGGGGGGGSGFGAGGGIAFNSYCCGNTNGSTGGLLTGGAGGTTNACGGSGCGSIVEQGGVGGTGGASGSVGATGGSNNVGAPGAAGGAAGACIVGNSNITWVSFGTRNGSIS
jgi:hypothetical protein